MTTRTVGFIGLGAMGEPMAANLLRAGVDVVSCANRNREPIERLAESGLREVAGRALVGAEADIVMTVVWDEDQNDRVLRGPDGAIEAMSPGDTVIVMSPSHLPTASSSPSKLPSLGSLCSIVQSVAWSKEQSKELSRS